MPSINSCATQAEILYKLIEECACLKGDGSEIVLDLFCGTGTIGLTLAKRSFSPAMLFCLRVYLPNFVFFLSFSIFLG